MDFNDIKAILEQQGEAFEQFKRNESERITSMEAELNDLAKKAGRPVIGGSTGKPAPGQVWYDTKTKARLPVLRPDESLAALEGKSDTTPSMGRVLRGLVMGGSADDARELEDERKALSMSADPAGGYTVAGALSSSWIDLLRAQMVLTRAGAMTVPMDSNTLALARLTADPTISWHAENGALTATEPTFGQMTLTAKTVACLVKMSLELSQDSANIEQILQTSITNSMANAIDAAGLVGVTTDAAAAPGGVFDLSGRNTVTSIGAPTSWDFLVDGMYELMLDNVPQASIGAMVAHPALWKKLRKLKTGITNDNTPLTMPAEVAALPKLWTTAAPLTGGTTAKAVVANWSDLLFGVRKGITVKVLSERFLGDNLQIAVLAYARVDFGAVRAASFCTLEGLTV